MKKLLLFSCVVLMTLLCASCHTSKNQNALGYDRSKVEEIIVGHDTTILYFMTSWCQAGQSDFERNLKPYLNKASDTKAIVVVCVGELEQVSSLENVAENVRFFEVPSLNSLSDKIFINKECKKLLKGYKRVNYVPVRLVCNRHGEILNWNTDKESDRMYGSIYLFL